MNTNVNKEIKPFLDDIAERLWSGHAAIMVGAGFSKNADPVVGAKNTFPSWAELGNIFFEKVNGESPQLGNNYINVLKLADEVSAAFGRPTLDQILKNHIDDSGHKPNDLFHKLLDLNWSDVFTTNYDTLLERAKDNITSRNYQVIAKKEDLINSRSPRIIKLHGSFPNTPFVISEEDYRTYPRKFAAFVNTVQQTLLEKSLCLIGFSGDDPNFLQWIGWIRDNFPESTPLKIYLIGIINLSEAQKKLLYQRHINIIDFGNTEGVDGSHATAFRIFFDYLKLQKAKDNFLDWPDKENNLNTPDLNISDNSTQISQVVSLWQKSRQQYPGWRIVPKDQRKILWRNTEHWASFLKKCSELDSFLVFNFLYELSWRLDKALAVTWDDIATKISETIKMFWPFPDVMTTVDASHSILSTEKNIKWSQIRQQWIYLSFCLLRYYREEGQSEEWDKTKTILTSITAYLSPTDQEKLSYEIALQYLFQLEINTLKDFLQHWKPNQELPFWEAKRAGLIAELGDVSEATQILESALVKVRKKQSLKPITNDYSNISDESYILYLLSNVKLSEDILSRNYNFKDSRTPSERRNFLYQYKCDPWGEFNELSIYLERSLPVKKARERKYSFDIGFSSETLNFPSDREVLKAYEYLRLCEDISLPFQLPGVSINQEASISSVEKISPYSPHWALITLLRIGSEKAVDKLFSRKAISQLTTEESDKLIQTYLKALMANKEDIELNQPHAYRMGISSKLGEVIPEILSRLITKSSEFYRYEVFKYLLTLFEGAKIEKYKNINNIYKRFFATLDSETIYRLIPDILKIKVPNEYNKFQMNHIKNPFFYIKIDKDELTNYKKIKIDNALIGDLLEQAKSTEESIRDWALSSLLSLHNYGLLNKQLTKAFASVAWSMLDEYNFPKCNVFYKCVWSDLSPPKVKGIDVKSQIHKMIISAKIHIQVESDNPNSFTITGDATPIFNEVLIANKNIKFSEKEIEDFLDKLIDWWDKDKLLLTKYHHDDGIYKELKNRFSYITPLLVSFIIPNLKHTSAVVKIRKLIEDLSFNGIPCLRASTLLHMSSVSKELIQQIKYGIGSKSRAVTDDACLAVELLCKDKSIPDTLENLILETVHSIHWQTKHMYSAVQTLDNIFTTNINLYSKVVEKQVLIALFQIANSTKYENADNTLIHKYLIIRKQSAKLSKTLYEKHYKNLNGSLPKELMIWKEICQSTYEFNDIKCAWPTS